MFFKKTFILLVQTQTADIPKSPQKQWIGIIGEDDSLRGDSLDKLQMMCNWEHVCVMACEHFGGLCRCVAFYLQTCRFLFAHVNVIHAFFMSQQIQY